MATITLTLTDVEQDGEAMVHLSTDWSGVAATDMVRPTQAMFAVKEIQHLFANGGIDANAAYARMVAEAEQRVVSAGKEGE